MAAFAIGNQVTPTKGEWMGKTMIVQELKGEIVVCISTDGKRVAKFQAADLIDKGKLPGPATIKITR